MGARMTTGATYDEIADWYEHEFLGAPGAEHRDGNPRGLRPLLDELLGRGPGVCLEIGCGTGIHAGHVRGLGWTPIGLDLSAGMLRYASARLPVARADAARLPVADASVDAVLAAMIHTDVADYPTVLREASRVLRPAGLFVHMGVHPCFCGGFADRRHPDAVVIRPGYLDGAWTRTSWTDRGVRDKVGAAHLPLAALLNAVRSAGMAFERFAELGAPTPVVMGIATRKVLSCGHADHRS
jgi:SAM-dependent methyltransferase